MANTPGLKMSMKAQSTIMRSAVVKSMLVGINDSMISSTSTSPLFIYFAHCDKMIITQCAK
ncbi:hypothetical protein PACILC2_27670 [Paenibacillus cisolokensis]|uniref:Uncharacterized protein n=1 Tax=Paenibacillus cisolokensis TaxID=1658519 RepID=A0ABQ4N7M8_9BACL|nr:hypothetical protein PACILC2_27670 [Paenibacillus cisolokensis]